MIRVLLVDDQALVRTGLRMILEETDDITVACEAADGDQAAELAGRLGPDIVLMDVRMPCTDGIEATARIRAAAGDSATPRVLILTTFDLDRYVYAALRAGASGFLLKDALAADLVSAIRTIAAGDAVIAPSATRRLIERFAETSALSEQLSAERLSLLTDREREVLTLIGAAQSNAEIARHLFLSEGTVKAHVSRILTKLALRDRVQAVVLAYETGLVRPGST
jgi:DNA-binding NarL/FixJ family response regulator